MGNIKAFILFTVILLLTACSSNTGRYKHANDSTPSRIPNEAELTDAIARAEPHSRGGNKDYNVRGIDYQVLDTAHGFEQTGTASWYGKKFHGHLTSNGELYDMYGMSAAHKNLPLPTYLKVTNLANNKSVIVRVNDRGPFHQDRIIDLSYSAAYKLDMLKTGTATVKISSITDFGQKKTPKTKTTIVASEKVASKSTKAVSSTTTSTTKNIIQVLATSKLNVAKLTANNLATIYSHPVNFPEKDGIYRIQIGPIDNKEQQELLLKKLKENGYPQAYLKSL